MKTKNELRRNILSVRNKMNREEVLKKSSIIIDKLVKLDVFKQSKTIFVYMDFKNEVKTIPLIKQMLLDGKNVVVSYTDVKNVKLIPVRLRDLENDLEKSPFGYLQPKKNLIVPVEVEKLDLIIVPGVVFGMDLNRIGFGKGYYDRVLEIKRKDAKAIAIAYEFQIQDKIPSEEHDVKMDMIITEEKIYKS
jgi:5-formyltetrahydrofolate cyclo-ligase